MREGPSALEGAAALAPSSVKVEAARRPYLAPLLSLAESFRGEVDSPWQEALALLPMV